MSLGLLVGAHDINAHYIERQSILCIVWSHYLEIDGCNYQHILIEIDGWEYGNMQCGGSIYGWAYSCKVLMML